MFTRAGFNPRHREICCARSMRRGRYVWARLVIWLPGGDLGWYGFKPSRLSFVAWQLRSFDTLLELPPAVHRAIWLSESCRLEEAPRPRALDPLARVLP